VEPELFAPKRICHFFALWKKEPSNRRSIFLPIHSAATLHQLLNFSRRIIFGLPILKEYRTLLMCKRTKKNLYVYVNFPRREQKRMAGETSPSSFKTA
jgi:hypothetical protein